MESWLKKFIVVLLVTSMVIGISGMVLHTSDSMSDLSHHQGDCEICVIYQGLSSALPLLPFLLALILTIVTVRVYTLGQQELAGIELLEIRFGIDPPPVILPS